VTQVLVALVHVWLGPHWLEVAHAVPSGGELAQLPQVVAAGMLQKALWHCAENAQPAPFGRAPGMAAHAATGLPSKRSAQPCWGSAAAHASTEAGVAAVPGAAKPWRHTS
jgi:hypothetical protein